MALPIPYDRVFLEITDREYSRVPRHGTRL